MEDLNVPDISECSVAEKAHYFEEQIQKEMTKVPSRLHQQASLKSEKDKSPRTKITEREQEERYITELKDAVEDVERKGVKTLITESEKENCEIKGDDDMNVRDINMIERKEGDYATEKTDKPEKLEMDAEKVDSLVQDAEECIKQAVEHKDKLEIKGIKEQEIILDNLEDQRKVIVHANSDIYMKDSEEVQWHERKDMQKEVEISTSVRVQESVQQKRQEETSEFVTQESMGIKMTRDAEDKEERVKQSVTVTILEKEKLKSTEERKEGTKELVTEVTEETMIEDTKQEGSSKDSVAEVSPEKEIIQDIDEREEDSKESEKEVTESVTDTKLEQTAEIAEKVKQKVIEEIVREVSVTDVQKEQKESKDSVKEIHIEHEMVKCMETAEKNMQELPTDVSVKQEILEDVKEQREDTQQYSTDLDVKPESVKNVEATEDLEGPIAEARVGQHTEKDVKETKGKGQEVIEDIGVQQEWSIKDTKEVDAKHTTDEDKDTKESISGVMLQKEKVADLEIKKENIVTEKSKGKRIITEETTIIYKVQKDGTLVEEQVLKSVQIGDGSGIMKTYTDFIDSSAIQSRDDIEPKIQGILEEKRIINAKVKGEIAPPIMQEEELKLSETSTDQEAGIRGETDAKNDEEPVAVEEEAVAEAETKQIKKESRIPISMSKMDKDKVQKEVKIKVFPESKQFAKSDGVKDSSVEVPDTVSVTIKKREFESKIPKRVMDAKSTAEKSGQKDTHVRKESEPYTITEKKSSEEVTSKLEEHSTTKSETQTFSKIFTDPQDAFKMFENMDNMKNDFATVTSKVDQKTSSMLAKKEIISSEIHSGPDKIITLEEKERVEKKKSSESQLKKESPTETLEEKKSKHEELDKTAVQKMSMNVTEKEEIIDATASESMAKTKEEKTFKKLSDKTGVTTHEAGSITVQESDADVAMRIKKDISEGVGDKDGIKVTVEEIATERISEAVADSGQVETIAHAESHTETKESFEVTQFQPSDTTAQEKELLKEDRIITNVEEHVPGIESLEERQRQKFNEIEARTIAETLIQSIESELEAKSAESLKTELLSKGYLEQIIKEGTETDHEKLADELTRKFENIMKNLADKETDQCTIDGNLIQQSKLGASMQEELYEKGSTRDSISVSEDITKDEESSPQEKEESFALSSLQARLHDRDITMSPSSMSEQIDFEETIDVDTNELEDISKSTLSPHSEKHRSDRSGKGAELQRDPQSETSSPQDKIVSELSGARVLEILEPGVESQSRQDSVDVPSLETDEQKISEQTSRGIPSLRESADTDSFERMVPERGITVSPSTVSEITNVDSSSVQEPPVPVTAQQEHEVASTKRTDSFEIESPPMMSPKLKVHDLEIQPVSWMIGEKKIEISETLEPSQIFNQELEAYESSRQRERLSSQDESVDYEQESGTKSSEEISVIESMKGTCVGDKHVATSVSRDAKITEQPISEQDFENELVENKLDVSCQELVDTLQREHDANILNKEYVESSQPQGRPSEQREEMEKRQETGLEDVKKEETKEEHIIDKHTGAAVDTEHHEAKSSEQMSGEAIEADVSLYDQCSKKEEAGPKVDDVVSRPEIELKLERTMLSKDSEKLREEVAQALANADKTARVDDVLKEWTETYLSKMKPLGDDYKRHIEKTTEKHDKSGRSTTVPSDTCAFKIKKDDFSSVDLSARYAITVLDQVVKKEIAEVKESLEAAKQDLIEELNENSETVIQIKDSPSEFQFKLQPESIPNDLPFLYKSPSPERDTETKSDSPVPASQPHESPKWESRDTTESKMDYEESPFSSFDEPINIPKCKMPVIKTEKSDSETAITVHDDSRDEDEERPSPVFASRSGSDIDNKDESSSLALPRTVLRRRHKPSRSSKRVTSDSDADIGSSSGDSSNYQSCEYESGSRPSSSDIEAMQSCGVASATVSEYETAVMSMDTSSSKPTSHEYHTAATSMSSRESMKSLASLSSGHLGSIDSTSELSETLVASEADADKEEIEENLKCALEDERTEHSDSSGSDIPVDDAIDKIDGHISYRMKRSSEMIFPQLLESDATIDDERKEESMPKDAKGVDFASSTATPMLGALQSVDIMTSRVSEDGVQSVCTQVISVQATKDVPADVGTFVAEIESKVSDLKAPEKDTEIVSDTQITESDILEQKHSADGLSSESLEISMQTSTPSMIQQASMSTSSASGVSVSTVVGKEKSDRHSPDSDSFEMVDKPDIIDDFVVIEEVGREAEEYDSEGKSIRISAMPQISNKNYDRDLENLIAEKKEDSQASQPTKNTDVFDFESEESPPQASNEDQYSQSCSDEEQYDANQKWVKTQFYSDPRGYDIEYDPYLQRLEDIKEEEITDFEAGSSRFGSLGSHKESIGSVGSMRGSLGSTPEYDILAGKKCFVRPSDHDNVSLSSLQEFEHLESAVAAENSKKLQCGSHDSVNNGSLPRRYMASRSGHGDDVSLSSLKDFEGLEKACREAHLIELRAREEEDLLEHESPENKYKLESLARTRVDTSTAGSFNPSTAGSFNPSTSGSDDYEKRIKEIDEIIRIAQTNVEKFDRQDDTTEDISQIEIMDIEKTEPPPQVLAQSVSKQEEPKDTNLHKESNVMETSTDSLELDDNMDKKHHPLCRSSDSLEMKTTLDFPSLSSDSLNNVRDGKEAQSDVVGYASNLRRISSDSLDMPLLDQQTVESQGRTSEHDHSDGAPSDNSLDQGPETTENNLRTDKTRTTPSTGT